LITSAKRVKIILMIAIKDPYLFLYILFVTKLLNDRMLSGSKINIGKTKCLQF